VIFHKVLLHFEGIHPASLISKEIFDEWCPETSIDRNHYRRLRNPAGEIALSAAGLPAAISSQLTKP
jgi:hypothetical protein